MIWMYRSGKPEDPFIPITQTLRIKDGVVLLEEIPDNFQRPTVTHDTITFSEIQSGDPGATNYRIIYKYGIIVFNHVNNGELVTINYFGTGRFFLPANRVYAQIDDENNVTQSLKDLLDDNEAAIEAITTLADLVSQINEFQHMGTYDPAIIYKVRNVVDDNSGNSFMAVQESVGQSLSDTTYWRPIALKEVTGRLVKSVAGNLDITLTDAEALNKQIIFTGELTGNINVVFPTTTRIWHVQNLTTGEYTLGCKTASGEGIILKQANPPDFPRVKQITSDGTDIIWADEGNVLETHKAESANKHIHSSGENWIRFDDGTQICYASFGVDDTLEYGSGTYSDPYRSASITFEYPVSFVSLPTVTASCISEATSYHRGVVPIIHTPTVEWCQVQVFRITSSSTDMRVTVFVQAIGRWK